MSLTVRQIKVSDLKEHPRNARRGNVPKIMESLETHGQYRALVVQASSMTVCAGNHTLQAARRLGWKTVACHVLDITDEQALRILVVDNRTSDQADYDREALAHILDDLSELTGTGWDQMDVDDLIASLDEQAATPISGWEQPPPAADEIRSIVLTYDTDRFVTITDRLATVRERHGLDSNTAAVIRLLTDDNPDSPPPPAGAPE